MMRRQYSFFLLYQRGNANTFERTKGESVAICRFFGAIVLPCQNLASWELASQKVA